MYMNVKKYKKILVKLKTKAKIYIKYKNVLKLCSTYSIIICGFKNLKIIFKTVEKIVKREEAI